MNCKQKFLCSLVFGLLLIAGAAFADTILPEVYTFDGNPIQGEHVDGEILVMLELPSSISSATGEAFEAGLISSSQSVAESIGARAVQTYGANAAETGRNDVHMKGEGRTTEQLLAALNGRPGVVGAAPNYISHALALPNDPRYNELWGMTTINAPQAWDITTGSSQVIVAVLDTGISYNHPDLAGNIARDLENNIGRNCVVGAPDINDPYDIYGHGTHVAGTIGAVGNNSTGVAGINWRVGLLGVKVLNDQGSGSGNEIIAGMNYVLDQKRRGLNIKVVNMSLGGWWNPVPNPEADPYGSTVKALSDAGIVVVIAAGNEFQNIDNPGGPGSDPSDPSYDYRGELPYPACFRFANTITVAAITKETTRSQYSNYSPRYVDLAAPGGLTRYSGDPDGILSTVPGNVYEFYQGTSMATPHVAGAAALIAAAHPTENAGQIKARILENVTPNGNLNGLVARNGHLNLNAAIRGTTPTPTPDPDVRVTGVTVSPTSLRLAVGQSATLTATITPANAADQEVTWTTSNVKVVEGTMSGLTASINAVSNGTAVVTVTTNDGGFTATCNVTVGGGGGGGGGGCSVGGTAVPLALLLAAPLALLLRRK